MPVKSAGKQGQLELECGPNRHKTHLLFRYFFYLSLVFKQKTCSGLIAKAGFSTS